MSAPDRGPSISVGGNVEGSGLAAGTKITMNVETRVTKSASDVDIKPVLDAIGLTLKSLNSPDQIIITNALSEIDHELKKETPQANRIGESLERAVKCAKESPDFPSVLGALEEPIRKATGWLGGNWHKLLPLIGLA